MDQLRKGVLEYCILAAVHKSPTYGYQIRQTLREHGVLSDNPGTVYAILGRMDARGLLEAHHVRSPSGPPRRYFELTDQGRGALASFAAVWPDFTASVDALLVADALPMTVRREP